MLQAPDAPPQPPPREGLGETFRRLGGGGPVWGGALILPPVGTVVLYWNISSISAWLREQDQQGLAIYAACFAILAGLALLPTYAQAIIGGWAFGMAWGLPGALIGFLGGAVIGYEVARRASGDKVVAMIEPRPRLRAVRDALIGPEGGHGFWKTLGIVTLVRLPPNSPFALTNLAMASVHVPRAPFLLGTVFGLTPRTAAAVFVGQGLHQLTRESVREATPKWLWALGIALTMVVLLLIGAVAKRALDRVAPAPTP